MATDSAIVKVREYARSPQILERFAEIVGQHNVGAYVSSVLLAVAQSDKLQECSPQSIVSAAMRAAALRLSCDPATKQAHLVPYKGKATFVIGYKGLYDMAIRTGKYRYLNAFMVYEGEDVVEDRMTGTHKLEGRRTGNNPIGYMLAFQMLNGFAHTYYMTLEEVKAHAEKYSKSWGYKDSPWTTDFDKMALKTVIRMGLGKYGYFDPHDSMVMATEETEESGDQLPAPEEVTQPEHKPMSAEQAAADLFGGDAIEGQLLSREEAEADAWKSEKISLERARSLTASDGATYWSMKNGELAERLAAVNQRIDANKLTAEQRDDLVMRRDTIQAIIAFRQPEQAGLF